MNNIVNHVKQNSICSSCKNNNNVVIAKADSGASHHYIRPDDAKILTDYKEKDSTSVMQSDGTSMTTAGTGKLPLHSSL